MALLRDVGIAMMSTECPGPLNGTLSHDPQPLSHPRLMAKSSKNSTVLGEGHLQQLKHHLYHLKQLKSIMKPP